MLPTRLRVCGFLRSLCFFNSFLRTQILQPASLWASLREASCTKLGHLMRLTASTLDVLRERGKITSIRLINRMVAEVCTALAQHVQQFVRDQTLCEQWSEDSEYRFPCLSVAPEVGKQQKGGGQLLSVTTSHLGKFRDVSKERALSGLCQSS